MANPLILIGKQNAPNTLEIFLDFVCPNSKLLVDTSINNAAGDGSSPSTGVLGLLLGENGAYSDQVKVRESVSQLFG